MKKLIIPCVALLLFGCSGKTEKIDVERVEGGMIIEVNLTQYLINIKKGENLITFITIDGLADCGCSDSEATLLNYSKTKEVPMYRLSFNMESESYVSDYNYLVAETAEDGVNIIPELQVAENGAITTPLMPRLLVFSETYLVFQTDKDFEKKLNTYINVI